MQKPAGLNIAIFASGQGSNFQAIYDAIERGKIPVARIVVVISNNSNAGALERARRLGLPAVHLSRPQFASDEIFAQAILATLRSHQANFIALAGYMKKLDPAVLHEYANRVVNIHPALLPAFGGKGMYGMRVHEAVIASGAKRSGATVHIVTDEYDRGSILAQGTTTIEAGETAETLAAKVLKIEHQIYPEAIRRMAEGSLALDDGDALGTNG
jgi:phosphoribosylglycinamide formyltransferase-1